ncbi:MAG: hypothetical protein NC299_15315 [Lachnospiraceae bacterium]|nr:hypothetical protein [Lachnospiraceae bacterium]
MADYVSKEAAMDAGMLCNWYISSIDETKPPVWTEEHIEELLNDFLVIPKETPTADVRPERHGRWVPDGDCVVCSECGEEHCWQDYRASYCEDCGAKMDGKENADEEDM